ncbi:hypothetical protein GNX71_28575 [Variovorax sp. RKNM96]|uniref:hypothetical protein n=1 Tax=Variovorax sp. RKNM96 TaxID=2681552 RepID=UPI00197E2307|nr:hypothetical protein [Variovorax sp. RKNM96]QSI33309.1 hypothetical protein GNX71_28575 [Variovorax sp. RKNM96]
MLEGFLRWIEGHPGTASWMQALGAVASIVVAFWIGRSQSWAALRNSRLLAEDAEQGRRAAILEIARMCADRAEAVGQIFSTQPISRAKFFDEYHPSVIESRVAAVSAIPAHEVGSAEAAAALLDLRDQLVFLRNAVHDWDSGKGKGTDSDRVDGDSLSRDKVWCDNIHRHIKNIWDNYEKMKLALSSSRLGKL